MNKKNINKKHTVRYIRRDKIEIDGEIFMPEPYTQALLEDLKDDFRTMGDGLKVVQEKLDEHTKRFEALEERIEKFEIKVYARFHAFEERFNQIDKELLSIRIELEDIKRELINKVDEKQIIKLEQRMSVIEKEVYGK